MLPNIPVSASDPKAISLTAGKLAAIVVITAIIAAVIAGAIGYAVANNKSTNTDSTAQVTTTTPQVATTTPEVSTTPQHQATTYTVKTTYKDPSQKYFNVAGMVFSPTTLTIYTNDTVNMDPFYGFAFDGKNQVFSVVLDGQGSINLSHIVTISNLSVGKHTIQFYGCTNTQCLSPYTDNGPVNTFVIDVKAL